MLKKLYFPAFFLFLISIKSLFLSPNIADSLMFLSMSVLFGFLFYLEDRKEKPVNDEIRKKIEATNTQLKEIETELKEKIDKAYQESQEIKTFLNTSKMLNISSFGMRK